jgi:DNA polymerase I
LLADRAVLPTWGCMEDDWLWGWDPTPGIVSVWAELDGRAFVWRREPGSRAVLREDVRFQSWLLLSSLDDLEHLGTSLTPAGAARGDGLGHFGRCPTPARGEGGAPLDRCPTPGRDGCPTPGRGGIARMDRRQAPGRGRVTYEELEGPGALRFLVRAEDGRFLQDAVVRGAARRLGRAVRHVRELEQSEVLALAPEEQYLVASGRAYFRGLGFDDLRRLQLDLETSSLDPDEGRIFLVAVRDPDGQVHVLEARDDSDAGEAELIRRLAACVAAADPDVIENHNLHGFDLPFLARRARLLDVPISLGRAGGPGLRLRPAARGASLARGTVDRMPELPRRARYTVPGRELIDTMDAVRRHDFSARDLPGHGLKAVARHFGLARADREHIPGARVHDVYRSDPDRVRRYAGDDVTEAAGLARLLGGAAFALAGMAPRRYERLADAGAATGVLDPMLVRAYLRAGAALPARAAGDGTAHSGAALHLFATGVAHRIIKADVASLYPSLMRQYRIGPARDRLGAFLSLVDRWVEQRLAAKAAARAAPPGSAQRHTHDALAAAMKIVVNSAYGYLGAGGLTHFADVHAANEVTRRGREVLALLCRELAARGVTLLEADTDGVYGAVPDSWTEADERRAVAEVAALLPAKVQLEFDGRYAAMLSHEPKNYALEGYDGALHLRGVAFRSSRAEPFGEDFLRRALPPLLAGDLAAVQRAYFTTISALRRRNVPTADVSARVRLTKPPEEYLASRGKRRELPYEAMLAAGRQHWHVGERVRVYRATGGRPGLLVEDDGLDDDEGDDEAPALDPRDYDAEYYVRLLRETFCARLARALTPDDFAEVFADPDQGSLFARPMAAVRPILTVLAAPLEMADVDGGPTDEPSD